MGRLVFASTRAVVGGLAASTAMLSRRNETTVMSRGGTAMYWSGFARGAMTLLLQNND